MKPCKNQLLIIRYGTGPTPAGRAFLALSPRGICALHLADVSQQPRILREIRRRFPTAELVHDQKAIAPALEQLRDLLTGRGKTMDMPLDLWGTPFQRRVWHGLQRVPAGTTCSYSELARRIGRPTAVRAVANACARNPVGILVPCHRVLRQDGRLGGYRWGVGRKRALLRLEKEIAFGCKNDNYQIHTGPRSALARTRLQRGRQRSAQ